MDAEKMFADWRAALKKIGPPPVTEIRVGSTLRFADALGAAGARSDYTGKGWWSVAGVQVRVSPIVPEHIAIVMLGDEVVSIINLDAPRKEQS